MQHLIQRLSLVTKITEKQSKDGSEQLLTTILPINVSRQGICSYHYNSLVHSCLNELRSRYDCQNEAAAGSGEVQRQRLFCSKHCLHLRNRRAFNARSLSFSKAPICEWLRVVDKVKSDDRGVPAQEHFDATENVLDLVTAA